MRGSPAALSFSQIPLINFTMKKRLHTRTHSISPSEISGFPDNKTWFKKNEYVVIGLIVLIIVIAGCIVLNVLRV